MIVEPQEQVAEEFASLEPQALNEAATPEPQKQEAAVEAEVPEKYKGKSVAELARMHEEAQRFISRQANEVHEVRKLADDLIKRQINAEKASQPTQTEGAPEVDFFENPQEAVKRTLESSPEIQEMRALKKQMKAQETMSKLSQLHPDAMDVAKSPEFVEWVKGSKVRLAMFAQADSEYDLDAAAELLTSFKAQKGYSTKVVQPAVSDQKQALRAAAVDTNGSNEGSSKKIYRRADIMRLMNTDPERYQMMQPEILAAYAERRVR